MKNNKVCPNGYGKIFSDEETGEIENKFFPEIFWEKK